MRVEVAVRLRPQNDHEVEQQANICATVISNERKVTMGDKPFIFDFVFDQFASQEEIYDGCIKRLVEGTFEGYNATVLAYGQTGSGKTYTMGSNSDKIELPDKCDKAGMIPRAAQQFFDSIETIKAKASSEGKTEPSFELSTQFVELYNNEIIDLMANGRDRNKQIEIREDANEIFLQGTKSIKVNSTVDILEALRRGTRNRKTGKTKMNEKSSRSHAIFTVIVSQKRFVPTENNNEGIASTSSAIEENISAKFHFVDLAGSERQKRTEAVGDRLREGINNNEGLFALGNVINALGGPNGRQTHVPYRNSKLTRILQDSLGGNSRTVMIACASPSDIDFVETLNTLMYANRAKNIRNTVVANKQRTDESRQNAEDRARILLLENQILELFTELNEYRQDKSASDVITNLRTSDQDWVVSDKSEMSEVEQMDAIEFAKVALQKETEFSDMAEFIKGEFDKTHGGMWCCSVGIFGHYALNTDHVENHYIEYHLGELGIVLFMIKETALDVDEQIPTGEENIDLPLLICDDEDPHNGEPAAKRRQKEKKNRRRGRAFQLKQPQHATNFDVSSDSVIVDILTGPASSRRGRGRPRKYPKKTTPPRLGKRQMKGFLNAFYYRQKHRGKKIAAKSAHPRPRPPRPTSNDGDNVSVTQQQQNPTGGAVAGGSIPPTSISTVPATHQQRQVPTNVVEEQLPSTSSDTNPVTPKEQVPTDVVGDSASDSTNYAGSHSDGAERSLSLQSDDSSTHQQQVHSDGVGATSDSGDDHAILSSLQSTTSDNDPTSDQQQDLTADDVGASSDYAHDPSILAKFHNAD